MLNMTKNPDMNTTRTLAVEPTLDVLADVIGRAMPGEYRDVLRKVRDLVPLAGWASTNTVPQGIKDRLTDEAYSLWRDLRAAYRPMRRSAVQDGCTWHTCGTYLLSVKPAKDALNAVIDALEGC